MSDDGRDRGVSFFCICKWYIWCTFVRMVHILYISHLVLQVSLNIFSIFTISITFRIVFIFNVFVFLARVAKTSIIVSMRTSRSTTWSVAGGGAQAQPESYSTASCVSNYMACSQGSHRRTGLWRTGQTGAAKPKGWHALPTESHQFSVTELLTQPDWANGLKCIGRCN